MINVSSSFRERILPRWDQLFEQLFPETVPAHFEWHDQQEFINVFSAIGAVPDLNHVFLPHRGGCELTGAAPSHEYRLLELRFSELAMIVAPRTLTCDVFTNNEWSYFRFQTDPIKPILTYHESIVPKWEELLEVSPGRYVDASCSDIGHIGFDEDGEEIPIPESARHVQRLISGGAFVIFCKASRYNLNPDTYNAPHNQTCAEAFRSFIANEAMRSC